MALSKLLFIIPKIRVKKAPFVIAAMVLGAGFEVLGIALVIPLMNVISSDESAVSDILKSYFPAISAETIMLSSIGMFAFVFMLKGVYLSWLAWVTGRFAYNIKADVGNSLMENYLSAPYDFHLTRNSAELIRNLTTETGQLVQFVINPSLKILTESIVLIAILFFLMAIETFGTLVVMTILLILADGFRRLFSGYTRKLGEVRQEADGKVIQSVQEALGGIKDVIALGKEKEFIDAYQYQNVLSSDVSAKHYALTQIPRMYLETIGAIVFAVLVAILVVRGDEWSHIVSLLGVFALAAFRLLPSANRVLSALNSLRFAENVITNFYDQLKSLDGAVTLNSAAGAAISRTSLTQGIEFRGVSYRYPSVKECALSDINLIINKGESIGVVGKSGAGKSTFTDTLLGLLRPSKGTIYFDGVSIHEDMKAWQTLIGYVPQDIFLLDRSLRSNIAFGVPDGQIDQDKVAYAIKEAQLEEFINSLPDGMETSLGERGVRLSGGQKQRIGIARALYRNAPILVFDEATSALDNATEADIVSAIKGFQGSRTTIVVAHRMSTIQHCDRIIELQSGAVVSIEDRKK